MPYLPILTLLALASQCCLGAAATDEVIRHPSFPKTKLNEGDRRAEYDRRNYSWPIEKFVPDTEGWNALMKQRMEQVDELEGLVSIECVIGVLRTFFNLSPMATRHYTGTTLRRIHAIFTIQPFSTQFHRIRFWLGTMSRRFTRRPARRNSRRVANSQVRRCRRSH